jgi:hypothetical protein
VRATSASIANIVLAAITVIAPSALTRLGREDHPWTLPDGGVQPVWPGQGALTPVAEDVAPTGCWVGAVRTGGWHEPGDRPIGSCLVVGVAGRTTAVTTIVCPFITIQHVR